MFRLGKIKDLESIVEIVKTVKKDMETEGNPQWDSEYPLASDFEKDINNGTLYVLEEEELLGFVVVDDVEPAPYNDLKWHSKEKAMVLHRMSVNPKFRNRGIGQRLIKFAQDICKRNQISVLKTDTHSSNVKMNSLFLKMGFEKIGEMDYHGKDTPYCCYEMPVTFKILVAYSSVTGNTEKLAYAIHKAFPMTDLVKWKDVNEQMLKDYDLIFLGGYNVRGHLDPSVTQNLNLLEGKKVAFFFTMGAMPTSKHGIESVINIVTDLKAAGIEVVNHYHCLGGITEKSKERMLKLPKTHSHYPDAFRIKKWEIAKDHPNEEDEFGASNFANDTIKKYTSVQ